MTPATQPTSTPGGGDIVAVMPYVRRLAGRLAGSARGCADLEDLYSEGCLAVVRCAPHYDRARGASWLTYALLRARSAMLDWMRGRNVFNQVFPRSRRPRPRIHLSADGWPGYNRRGRDGGSCAPPETQVPDGRGPEDCLAAGDLCAAAQRVLPPRERQAVRLYFFAGLTMAGAGVEMGCSESLVHDLVKRAVARMRAHLKGRAWEAREAVGV